MNSSNNVNINDTDNSLNLSINDNPGVYRLTQSSGPIPEESRENAAFLILVKNEELSDMVSSIKDLEKKFNSKYQYPYIFLNDKNFTQEFKDTIKLYTNSSVKFGLVLKDHWSIPSWIDQSKMRKIWDNLDYPHGKSESYRHMCRFQSGFFYKHPLVKELDYYWRVEPDVKFPCEINYDPFKFMKDNGKLYGFTIPIKEYIPTVKTLMPTIDNWIAENNLESNMPIDNAKQFVRKFYAGDYNGCQFWNNFEIASTEIFRSKQYESYFNYLDKAGGFFYERWGDAPIHTIYVSLFLKSNQVHFFEDIGYKHLWVTHCPRGSFHTKNNCDCDKDKSHDWNMRESCMTEYLKARDHINMGFLTETVLS